MRISIIGSLLFFSMLLGCSTTNHGVVDNSGTFNNHLSQGKTFQQKGQFEDAIKEYNAAIYLRHDSDEAHFLLGYVYFELYMQSHSQAQHKSLKDMFRLGSKASEPNLTSEELRRMYESYGERTDYEALANKEFATAAHLNPNNWMAHYFVAVDHLNNHRFNEAVLEYKQALSANPQHEISYSGLGSAYYELGQYELAIDNLKKAIALSQDISYSDYELALAYLKVGQKEKAIEILDKMKAHPGASFYNELYANIYGQYPPELLQKLGGE